MGRREYYIMGRVQMVINLNINSELHKTGLISQIKDCVSSYVIQASTTMGIRKHQMIL